MRSADLSMDDLAIHDWIRSAMEIFRNFQSVSKSFSTTSPGGRTVLEPNQTICCRKVDFSSVASVEGIMTGCDRQRKYSKFFSVSKSFSTMSPGGRTVLVGPSIEYFRISNEKATGWRALSPGVQGLKTSSEKRWLTGVVVKCQFISGSNCSPVPRLWIQILSRAQLTFCTISPAKLVTTRLILDYCLVLPEGRKIIAFPLSCGFPDSLEKKSFARQWSWPIDHFVFFFLI